MFHLAAFYQSVDPAGAYVQLASIGDAILTINSPKIQVPPLNQIVMVAAGLENTVAPRCRLVAPSLLTMFRDQLTPVNVAAAAAVLPMSPARLVDYRDTPVVLVPSEQLTAEILSDPAAAQIQWVLVWFADGPIALKTGKILTARGTVANALVAGVWTLNTLTFDDQLYRGRYQIVGFRPVSTTMIASRIIVPSQAWRPGAIGAANVSDVSGDIFRYGNMGIYGEFEDIDNIQVESLSTAADGAAVQQYFVDLIQVRAGQG
jgi:hypothetical protein